MKNVKIHCTIGPACNDPQILGDMLDAGMSTARVNLSHGSAESQRDKLDHFRAAALLHGRRDATIMFDIRGPEIRVKEIPGGSVSVSDGQQLILHCEDVDDQGSAESGDAGKGNSSGAGEGGDAGKGNGSTAAEAEGSTAADTAGGTAKTHGAGSTPLIRINYENLCREVEPGTQILIDDGKVSLTVESVIGQDIICHADRDGVIASRKGVNVPDVKLQMEYLGEDDREDILWCIENGVDLVAGSFIRRRADVETIRSLLKANGGEHIGVVAKIENKEAISNIEGIAEAADQVLVARGDMGVEIGFEKVPAVQKRIIRKCRELGKPVIIATQLIDSMTENLTPTRAEVSDIANAVFDGATDLLVTGETAAGKHPVEVVREMAVIIAQAEQDLSRYGEKIL